MKEYVRKPIGNLLESGNTRKTKRNKHTTECLVNQRVGCGVCGSLNICYQGVIYCLVCGLEVEILVDNRYWNYSDFVPCTCLAERKSGSKTYEYRSVRSILVGKCLDCGAVKSCFCPNCKNQNGCLVSRDCWKHWSGSTFCLTCGFKIGGLV